MFQVTERKCSQCLFSPNKIVSDERRRDVLDECRRKDSYFICHKSSIARGEVCCRGFYDTQNSQMMRIARRLNAVEFVPVPGEEQPVGSAE